MKESCLLGVQDGICCFITNTTIVPACTCLYPLHLNSQKHKATLRHHGKYNREHHQGDSSKSRKCPIIHYLQCTNYPFPIQLSGGWYHTEGSRHHQSFSRKERPILTKDAFTNSLVKLWWCFTYVMCSAWVIYCLADIELLQIYR